MKTRFNLKYKLILLTLISTILSILLVGGGVNFFLTKFHKRVAKEAILHSFDMLSKEFREIEQNMLNNLNILVHRNDIISFVNIINESFSKEDKAITFEKKRITNELLEQTRMNLNNIIAIYDKRGFLTNFIIKDKESLVHLLTAN